MVKNRAEKRFFPPRPKNFFNFSFRACLTIQREREYNKKKRIIKKFNDTHKRRSGKIDLGWNVKERNCMQPFYV